MVSIRHVLICAICISMVTPSESWFFRIRKVVNKTKKPFCKTLFGVVCPMGLKAAGSAATIATAGVGAAVWGGVAAGSAACLVTKDKACKRNLGDKTVMLPFSDNFNDFDKDQDGYITLKEFIEAVTSTIKLEDPQDLIEPFDESDTNDDGILDPNEFAKSEFLSPAENNKRMMNSAGNTAEKPDDGILDPNEFAKSEFLSPEENNKRIMNSAGNTAEKQSSDNFGDYDKNNDGYITFHEFEEAISPALNSNDPLDLLLPFSTIDTNGDGNLDQAEFVNSYFLFPDKV